MDDLIKSVKKFSIDNDTESLVSKLECLELSVYPEWETLKSNFSKLRYLDYLITKNNLKLPEKFNEALEHFLKDMDLITQRYLDNIDFNLNPGSEEIKNLLEKSLNCNKPILKMKYILGAYIILVPIVEECTNDTFKDNVDSNFIRVFKKQKVK